MGFKGTAAEQPELLSVKKNIQKFHINYQPSIKLKRQLKGHKMNYLKWILLGVCVLFVILPLLPKRTDNTKKER